MIANIRVHEGGEGRNLCQLDLMKFTEGQVRDRMEERGISDDAFFVCGFEDWGADTILSLSEAYALRDYINEECSGDDSLVSFLLKQHWAPETILERRFSYLGERDVDVLMALFEKRTTQDIAVLMHSFGSVPNLIVQYMKIGKIALTQKGYYISHWRD